MDDLPKCPLCEQPIAKSVLGRIAGYEGGLSVAVTGLPVWACAVRHRYFRSRKLAVWLLETLLSESAARIPAGRESGIVFKRYRCSACEAELPKRGAVEAMTAIDMAPKGLPPFQVEITVPTIHCGKCGLAQARSASELQQLVPSALVHAFQSAAIKAPG